MLLNILHTTLLTIGLGANVNIGTNTKAPNHRSTSTQALSATFNVTDETYGQYVIGERPNGIYYACNIYQKKYTFNTSNMSGEAVEVTLSSVSGGINGTTEVGTFINKDERVIPQPLATWQNLQIPNLQKIILWKIDNSNGLTNVRINERIVTELDTKPNTSKWVYGEVLETTSNAFSNLINGYSNANIMNWLTNGNLYDTYNNLKMSVSGYQTSVDDISRALITTIDPMLPIPDQYQNDINLVYTMSKVNYYVQYLQPQYKVTSGSNMYEITSNMPWTNSTNETLTMNGILYVNTGTTEVIDLPGVMFYILGMPFAFISTAFNLTLFPGTAYEVNLSMLFLAIFAVIVFVFLIKLILSKVK